MTPQEEVLTVARGELSVKESPAGSNKVKYNTWFYGREVSGKSYAWCCAFVCWVFAKAKLPNLIQKTASCTAMMNWFKRKGQTISPKDARPGDVVFFQFDSDSYADHIGIVESVTNGGVYAIEGNTSLTSDDNGGAVMRRFRKWNCMMTVARPAYGTVRKEDNMTKEEVQALIDQTVDAKITQAVQELSKQIIQASQETKSDLTPKVYTNLDELPAWAQFKVQRLLDAGILQGDGTGKLHLADHDMTTISIADKLLKKMENF